MTISEHSRHQVLNRLEQALGKEAAMTLAEHLPPVGWADVATKRDIESLEARLESQEARLEARLESLEARVEARLDRELRDLSLRLMVAFVTTMAAFAGILLTGIRLFVT